jgi:hypothetical protein
MKLLKFWKWIKSLFRHQKSGEVFVPDNDPSGMIKHKTKTLGFRSYGKHNNRKRTRGRNVQYIFIGNKSKPIYHGAL